MFKNIELYIFSSGKEYKVTNILEKVNWSGDYKSVARKLEFSLEYRLLPIEFKCGDLVAFYVNGIKLFDGYIWDDGLDSSSNRIELLAYDKGIYLLKNQLAYNFKNTKAESVANKVAADLKISIGNIVSTGIDITKVFLGDTAYEIIMTAYTQASKKTGKKYMCYIKDSKLHVEEKGAIKLKIGFEEGKNLINTKIRNTLDNMVNKVVIIDEKGNKKDEIKNDEWIKLYGMIQNIVQSQENKDVKEEARNTLHGVDTTCSLSGYGDIYCITGYGIKVKDSYTKLIGYFNINTDSHTWENGDYKIDLDISLENVMDEVTAGQDEQDESTGSSSGVTGGKEVDAEFTAYYPSNDPMQGGYKSANGETLKPSSLTCAAPKEIAFNTKIQVKGTGTSRDGICYRTNDRGGSIVIDKKGIYHIDLLMSTKKEAYDFGRRKGKAIIGVAETANSGGSGSNGSSDKANQAVAWARTKLGTPYLWGGVGPRYDCSGLTMKAYASVGITIPRVSKDQANHGKKVSKSELVNGDLVFFGNPTRHVGFYVGNNQYLHAPKTGDVVKISTFNRKDFTHGRRIV